MEKTQKDFLDWGLKIGIDKNIINSIIEFTATPEEIKEIIEKMLLPPPIYPLEDIQSMQEEDEMGISPMESGFLILGTCANGDPIAVDVKKDLGTVWYISHGEMYEGDLKSVSIQVAEDIPTFIQKLNENESFPMDYWEASE